MDSGSMDKVLACNVCMAASHEHLIRAVQAWKTCNDYYTVQHIVGQMI